MAWLKSTLVVLVLLALVLTGLLLGIDNHTPVALRFLNKQSPELPILWWLYGVFLAGVLTGLLIGGLGRARGRLNERRLRRSLREQGRELSQLRRTEGDVPGEAG